MQPLYITVAANGTTVAYSDWKMVNWHVTPINIGFGVVVTGVANCTVQHTFQDINGTYPNPAGAAITAFNHPTAQGLTSSADGAYNYPIAAIRLAVNSGTGSAMLIMLQADISGP